MQPKNIVSMLVVFAVIITLLAQNVNATTKNFTVPAQTEVTRSLDLQEDDRVAVGFTVVGESTNELNFYVTDPRGEIIVQHNKTGHVNFRIEAETTGTYTLHFDNTSSEESKMVTLNYDIQHYIFGIPQTLFFVTIIAVVSVIGVAIFAKLSKLG